MAVRVNAKNDYSRFRTATRSNCSFLCLFTRQIARLGKQANSSQRSCRPNAPHIQVLVLLAQLWISFRAQFIDISFNGETHPARDRRRRLGVQYHSIEGTLKRSVTCSPRLHFLSQHKSNRNLVLWPLSGFINRLETDLLVHALQLHLHLKSTVSRRSHVRVDKRGVRFRPVASRQTQALCDCSASSLDPVLPWSGECAATNSHTARIVRSTSQRSLPSGSQSVDGRSRSAPSSTGFPSCHGRALPRIH